jgi:hypothetical protein
VIETVRETQCERHSDRDGEGDTVIETEGDTVIETVRETQCERR